MAEPLPARPEQSTPADLAAAMPVALVGYGYWGSKLHAALRTRPAFEVRRLHVRSPLQLDPGDLAALAGVRKYPIRVKCALLGWIALDNGLASYVASQGGAWS